MSRVQGLRGNAWPDPTDAHLLRFLLHPDPDTAREAWATWRPYWDPESPTSEQYRLYPLMSERIVELGLDDDHLGRLRGVRRQQTIRNLLSLDQLDDIVDVLDGAGYDVVLLKGAALALTVYDHIGQRPFHDLDILVNPSRFAAALADLERDGWSRVYHYDPGLWDHAVTLQRGDVTLDVHRRHCRELVIPGRLEMSWETIQTVIAPRPLRSGRSMHVLAPADTLIHTLAHGPLALQPINIRWVVDAQRVVSAGIDWDRAITLAATYQVSELIRDGLIYLRDTTGTPVPDDVLLDLAAIRLPFLARRRIAAFHELRDTSRRWGRFISQVDEFLELTRHLTVAGVIAAAPRQIMTTLPKHALRALRFRMRRLKGLLNSTHDRQSPGSHR